MRRRRQTKHTRIIRPPTTATYVSPSGTTVGAQRTPHLSAACAGPGTTALDPLLPDDDADANRNTPWPGRDGVTMSGVAAAWDAAPGCSVGGGRSRSPAFWPDGVVTLRVRGSGPGGACPGGRPPGDRTEAVGVRGPPVCSGSRTNTLAARALSRAARLGRVAGVAPAARRGSRCTWSGRHRAGVDWPHASQSAGVGGGVGFG
jgi:hypothetical protein